MSSINNSYEYYQSNQGLLSMLNKSKSGNPLINQLISNNEMKYQQKMESLGIGTKSGNDKYKKVNQAANSLLDALNSLSKEDLYRAEEGKEYDNSNLLKSVSNYVTAYNNTISNLTSCGGSLNNSFKTEFLEAFKENSEAFANIGITMSTDGKLSINQDKLKTAKAEDIQKLLGASSKYVKNISSSANSIDTIINKALAMRSTNYNANGLMM
ncbi:hypothetical protein [Pseudobutyrivibrio xylanivorans]|uniref:Flagellar hook-associated protein 2 C-terminus n=1 Tax=Pseudobutyrivibrio xylanivorans TaxID=185007 RepID=A0A1G5S226_PSEXY|nr:hypothetical protein [Pseudobutyrivibrio xylanivorans]SCZ80424.1 hypothetical protein SAMN02910350_02284 [Pseudobutyrivibrio xylanivorans]